jgi:deoxycytidylate deaminase
MTHKKTLSAATQMASEHVSGGRVRTVAMFTDKRYNVLCVAGNTYTKTHPQQALWANKRGSPDKQCLHAEIRAAIMLAKSGKAEKAKYLYIAAVSEAGNVLLAKPCVVCQMMLDESFPEIEVFWTKR